MAVKREARTMTTTGQAGGSTDDHDRDETSTLHKEIDKNSPQYLLTMSAPSKVLVVGSAMTDLTAYTPKIPAVGETIMGSSFQTSYGGKGANQAVQSARLGAPTAFIATVGQDSFGDSYVDALVKEGIDTEGVKQISESSTGIAVIWVDGNGMNSIVIVPGANMKMTPDDVTARLQRFFATSKDSVKVALLQNEIDLDANLATLRCCRANDVRTVFNPAPYTSPCSNLIHECSILCVNEVELQMMLRDFGILEAVELSSDDALLQSCLTVVDHCDSVHGDANCHLQHIIVTLGALGAVWVSRESRQAVRFIAPVVKAVDSVGAGDSFLGCLAACLADDVALGEAIRMSIICASFSVQSRGAQPSYAYKKDLTF